MTTLDSSASVQATIAKAGHAANEAIAHVEGRLAPYRDLAAEVPLKHFNVLGDVQLAYRAGRLVLLRSPALGGAVHAAEAPVNLRLAALWVLPDLVQKLRDACVYVLDEDSAYSTGRVVPDAVSAVRDLPCVRR